MTTILGLTILPGVFLQDALWLALALTAARWAPTPLSRRLAAILGAYVACEALFHVYMEDAAACMMRYVG